MVQENLQKIECLTDEMLAAAERAEWLVLVDLEKARRALINALFAKAPEAEVAASIAACIQHVIETDRHIIALGDASRRQLAEQLHGIGIGRRVQQAYGQHH